MSKFVLENNEIFWKGDRLLQIHHFAYQRLKIKFSHRNAYHLNPIMMQTLIFTPIRIYFRNSSKIWQSSTKALRNVINFLLDTIFFQRFWKLQSHEYGLWAVRRLFRAPPVKYHTCFQIQYSFIGRHVRYNPIILHTRVIAIDSGSLKHIR